MYEYSGNNELMEKGLKGLNRGKPRSSTIWFLVNLAKITLPDFRNAAALCYCIITEYDLWLCYITRNWIQTIRWIFCEFCVIYNLLSRCLLPDYRTHTAEKDALCFLHARYILPNPEIVLNTYKTFTIG